MALPTASPDDQQLQTLLFTLQQVVQSLNALNKTLASSPALGSLANTTLAQIQNFTSDAAAAAGGVPLWGLYLNSGVTPWVLAVRHV